MPKKRFGQHFLSDPGILGRIVSFSRIGADDHVVEIGPGRGALTLRLAAIAREVTAIEVDQDLIGPLRDTVPANVTVLHRDALEVDFSGLAPKPYPLVANLPYNIATPLIERFVAAREAIRSLTVMVQKEVADRILSGPGTKDYGPLSVGVQYYAQVERGFVLPPGAFAPPPKVHSRLIRLEWRPDIPGRPEFIRFVRGAFASRRKKLINNLQAMFPALERGAATEILGENGVEPDARPEEVSVEQFLLLFGALDRTHGHGAKTTSGRANPI